MQLKYNEFNQFNWKTQWFEASPKRAWVEDSWLQQNGTFQHVGQKYPWVVPLGTTLPKSQDNWTQFKK